MFAPVLIEILMLANCVLKFCVTYLCGDGRINCFETISIVNAVYRAII